MKSFLSAPFCLLIARDFNLRFIASYLGIMWAFIQPAVTLVIFYVVFSVGFKVRPQGGVGFMEWLVPGYLAWQYYAEVVSSGTQSIIEASYLVKKIKFEVEKLPVVKLMSGLIVHIFFVVVMLVWIEGPLAYRVQLIYYMIAMMSLAYGVIMLTSSLAVFTRDIQHVVTMCLQLGFWGTPVFWSEEMMPAGYRWIIELNPLWYIVEGYRQSVLGLGWFWERPETLYYWVVTLIIIWIGRVVFRKLRGQFADVI